MNSRYRPLVSICMITYNHEHYIRLAIEGVILQKCDFEIELVIGEDFSKDQTRKICDEYAKKYPFIRLLLSNTNLGIIENFSRSLQECQGRYIALCEGDDYWTDPYKLQKQVDFLEANPDYSLCFHNVKVKYENELPNDHVFEHLEEREFTGFEIYSKWLVSTCTVMFRNYKTISFPNWIVYGDIFLYLSLAEKGRIYCLGFEGSVYRRNIGGVSVTLSTDTVIRLYYQYHNMIKHFPQYSIISKNEKERYFSHLFNRPFDDRRLIKFRIRYMFKNPKKIISRYLPRTLKLLFIHPKIN